MAILEREMSVQFGKRLTCVPCVAVISGRLVRLLTETTGGEILLAFLAQTWPQKRSQSA